MSEHGATTVYVVDDDQLVLAIIVDLLESAGYQPQAFASPFEFLEKLDPLRPGCLVLDLRMPGMGGMEVLQRLEMLGARVHTVLLSGQGDVSAAVSAMQAGAVDFVEKPFRPDRLLATVERAIKASLAASAKAQVMQAQKAIALLDLSDREILTAAGHGESPDAAAVRLGVPPSLIEGAWQRILVQLGTTDIADAIEIARSAGLFTNNKIEVAE